jgi:hypothetical protein
MQGQDYDFRELLQEAVELSLAKLHPPVAHRIFRLPTVQAELLSGLLGQARALWIAWQRQDTQRVRKFDVEQFADVDARAEEPERLRECLARRAVGDACNRCGDNYPSVKVDILRKRGWPHA